MPRIVHEHLEVASRVLRERWLFLALALGYVALACAYHSFFDIQIGRYSTPFLGRMATRLYLLDSDLYTHLYSRTDLTLARVVDDLLHGDDSNVYGASAIATVLEEADIDPLLFNMVLVIASGVLLRAILQKRGIQSVSPLIILFLSPATIYYSQTITKEIILLFATSAFVFLIVGQLAWWRLAGLIPCILLTMFVRRQAAVPMLLVLVVLHASTLTIRRWFLAIFFGLCLLLPALYSSGLMHAEEAGVYRKEMAGGESGLGQYIDFGLQQVPLAGLVLVPIRALQNTLEPFPSTRFEDEAPGTINIYFIVLFTSFVMSWHYVVAFMRVTYRFVVGRLGDDPPYHRLVLVALLVWLTTAANAWVHTRYMFNVAPIIPVLAVIAKQKAGPSDAAHPNGWGSGWTLGAWSLTMIAYAVLLTRAYMAGTM